MSTTAIPQPSDYVGSLDGATPRTCQVKAPVFEGYVTARLRPRILPPDGYARTLSTTTVNLVNSGTTPVVMQFKSTDDESPSGTRTNVGAAVSLVAGGYKRGISIVPEQKFLELWAASGNGAVSIELTSALDWDVLGFDKLDTTYPAAAWQAST